MTKDITHQGYPKIVTVVGAHHDGRTNFMTAAWSTYLSHQPLLFGVSIAPERFTHDLIKNSEEFNCNFLPYSETEKIHKIGRVSGHDGDKIKKLNLEIEKGHSIKTPYLQSAYAVIECKLHKSVKAGDHTFFIGEISDAFGHEEAFTDQGIVNLKKVDPTLYLGSNTYVTTRQDQKVIQDK